MRAILVLLALLALPVSEGAVFAWSGGVVGIWTTVALVLLTAAVGVAMIRSQGLGLIRRAQAAMDRRESPQLELIEGAALALAGVCLLAPGFITDTIGFCLLIPPLRRSLAKRVAVTAEAQHARRAQVIDVDYVEVTPEDRSENPGAELDSPNRPR